MAVAPEGHQKKHEKKWRKQGSFSKETAAI